MTRTGPIVLRDAVVHTMARDGKPHIFRRGITWFCTRRPQRKQWSPRAWNAGKTPLEAFRKWFRSTYGLGV